MGPHPRAPRRRNLKYDLYRFGPRRVLPERAYQAYLTAKGINVLDCGCDSQESCDYPIFAKAAAEAVADGRCEKAS